MATRARERQERARRQTADTQWDIPVVLRADDVSDPGTVRHWCTGCGLPDPPVKEWNEWPPPPCPRCGSGWRWQGRHCDLDGTAAGPPDDGTCRECFAWRRYGSGQEHFGWAWWMICQRSGFGATTGCNHAHHDGEVWLASAG
jgi:hypothetical protein